MQQRRSGLVLLATLGVPRRDGTFQTLTQSTFDWLIG
jgi:hypothetical protein